MWVPNRSSMSCDLSVFVYQPVESVAVLEVGAPWLSRTRPHPIPILRNTVSARGHGCPVSSDLASVRTCEQARCNLS